MKNILVIGGSYFAGRVFVEEMCKETGVNLHVFNRGRFPLRVEGVTELVGDREDIEQIQQVIPAKDWDAVVDFCGYTPRHVEDVTRHVPGSIGHYIFISTTTVYASTRRIPVVETADKLAQAQPDLGDYDQYGYQKWLAECALPKACEPRRIPFTSLRPAIIYGPYNYAPRESFFFNLLVDKQPIPLPENDLALFNFIWVVDMARLIIACMTDERVYGEALNLASDELISYSRIVEVLEEITGKDLECVGMPVAAINEQGIELPFPLDEHLIYSGEKIRRLFEFDYTPFAAGMREALRYFLMVRKMEKEKGSA
jgi:nucleoside-diphosphate-sugar epimerase